MPHAIWKGFLRLSLVTCPISLSAATSEAQRVRFNQLNAKTGNRISLRPFDSVTDEPVDRADIVKGYEHERGEYVVVTNEELADLKIESSEILDLETFVDAEEIDPLYIDTPYHILPEGKIGAETFRVIAEAMRRQNKVGLGRVVFSSREHPVAVEVRDGGMLMSTLRTVDQVRESGWAPSTKEEPDAETVELAAHVIERKSGEFDPAKFRDRYQDALRELIEAKVSGKPRARPAIETPKVVNLMDALKKSLERDVAPIPVPKAKAKGKVPDHRQRSLMLPMAGGRKKAAEEAAPPAAAKRRKRA
jgi:DNA end-binding protein Ku